MVTRERGISVIVIKLESNTIMNGSTKRLIWSMSFEGKRKAVEYISSMDDGWIYQMMQLYICILDWSIKQHMRGWLFWFGKYINESYKIFFQSFLWYLFPSIYWAKKIKGRLRTSWKGSNLNSPHWGCINCQRKTGLTWE